MAIRLMLLSTAMAFSSSDNSIGFRTSSATLIFCTNAEFTVSDTSVGHAVSDTTPSTCRVVRATSTTWTPPSGDSVGPEWMPAIGFTRASRSQSSRARRSAPPTAARPAASPPKRSPDVSRIAGGGSRCRPSSRFARTAFRCTGGGPIRRASSVTAFVRRDRSRIYCTNKEPTN